MKKLYLLSGLIMGLMLFTGNNCYGQSDLKIGVGAVYGSKIESFGLQAGAVYGFTPQLRGAADVFYYFPDQPNQGDYSFWAININLHYLLVAQEKASFYALGGLNYATSKISGGGYSASSSDTGVNLGGGAEIGIGFASLYAEAKYVLGSADQLAISGGLRFNL